MGILTFDYFGLSPKGKARYFDCCIMSVRIRLAQFRQYCESEGVLMIIAYYAIFGYISTIVFQLAERIAVTEKSTKAVLGHYVDMLGFSYNAIPTRHEVPKKPYLQEYNIMIEQTHKTIKYCRYG